MNKIWFAVTVVGIAVLTVIEPDNVLSTLMDGASGALELSLTLIPVYVIWSGVLELMRESGLNRMVARLFEPMNRRLFGGESDETKSLISMNLAANLLGMGGAATPLGIRTIESMDDGGDRATENMQVFTVINTTSVQLIPSTVIAMRLQAGSTGASDVILPSLIVSAVTTVLAVMLVKVLRR